MKLSPQQRQTFIGYIAVWLVFLTVTLVFKRRWDGRFFAAVAAQTAAVAAQMWLYFTAYRWNSLLPGIFLGYPFSIWSGTYLALTLVCSAFMLVAPPQLLVYGAAAHGAFFVLFSPACYFAARAGKLLSDELFEQQEFLKSEYCLMLEQILDTYPGGAAGVRTAQVKAVAEQCADIKHWSFEKIDEQLQTKGFELKQSFADGDETRSLALCDEIEELFRQREEKCSKLRFVM